MALGHNDFMKQLKRVGALLKEQMPAWDVVTVPVDPKNPDVGNNLWLGSITAIQASAANVEAAWAFVSYINGDTFARVTAKASVNGAMPTRTTNLKDDEGRNLGAFYALQPNPDTPKGGGKVPQAFYMPFETLAMQELQAAYDGRKSIDEALKTLQQKGQYLLDQAVEAEQNKNNSK
ncbi:hypothetical protein D3C73_773420 [compost metagenome]